MAEGREEEEGEEGDVGKTAERREDDTPEQVALLEMWTGLPGYGMTMQEQAAEGAGGEGVPAMSEGCPALSKLRKALNLTDSAGVALQQSAEDEGNGTNKAAPIGLDPALEVGASFNTSTPTKMPMGACEIELKINL